MSYIKNGSYFISLGYTSGATLSVKATLSVYVDGELVGTSITQKSDTGVIGIAGLTAISLPPALAINKSIRIDLELEMQASGAASNYSIGNAIRLTNKGAILIK